MTNIEFTQTEFENAIADADNFLEHQRGGTLDGDFAASQVAERVATTAELAEDLLQSVPHPKHDGLYVPLSKHNANHFDAAATVLPGYMVLVPSALVERGPSAFYPAVVSEDGLNNPGTIRLHVLRQPYRQHLGIGAATMLSAAGQSETDGVGDHGRTANDGVEAEHFATLLAAGSDHNVQAAWRAGEHINHKWRDQTDTSVTTEVSDRLFGNDIPQTTLTITRQQVELGQAMLLWHEGLRDDAGQPETAVRDNALLVVQGLGFQALCEQNPVALDTIKDLLA